MMTDHAEMVPTSSSTSYIDTADLLDEELWLSLTRATQGPALPDKVAATTAVPRPAHVAQTAPLEDLDSWLTFSPQQPDMAWQNTSDALTSPGLTSVSTDATSVASTSSLGDGASVGVTAPRGIAAPRQRSDSEGNRSRSKVRTAEKPQVHRSASSNSRTALSPVRDVADPDQGGVGKSSKPRSRPARRASIGPAAAAMLRIPASAPGNKQNALLHLDTALASNAGVGTGPQSVPAIDAHYQHHNFAPGSPPVSAGPSFWPGPGSWPGVAPPPWPMNMAPPHLPHCGAAQAQVTQGFESWPIAHVPMVSPGMPPPHGEPAYSQANSHSRSHSQAMQGVFDGMSGLHVDHSPSQETAMTGIVAEQQQAPVSPVTTRSPPHQQGARRGSKSTCHGGASRVLEDVPEDRAATDNAVDEDDDDCDAEDVSMSVESAAVRSRGTTSAQPRSRSSDSRSSACATSANMNAATTTDRRARRRESHNLVERRRRDTINERIAELASLLPEAMLLDAIANSQSGGNASKVVKLPMPASAMATSSSPSGSSARLNGEDLASAPADSETLAAAQARPNKSIILRKSVDYIRALQDFIEHQRRQNAELQHQNEAMVMMMGAARADEGYPQAHHTEQQQQQQQHYAGPPQPYSEESTKRLWPDSMPGPVTPSMYHQHGSEALPGQSQQYVDALSHNELDAQQHHHQHAYHHQQSRPSLGEWLARHPEEQARYAGVRPTVATSPTQQKQVPAVATNAGADSDSWPSSSQSPQDGASSHQSSLGSASATSASPTLSAGANGLQGQGKGEGGQQAGGGATIKAESVEGAAASSTTST